MTHEAWHYTACDADGKRKARGTICGEGLETQELAVDELALRHHAAPEDVKVRRAGE